MCGVCKNVENTLPLIRKGFAEMVAKSDVPCWAVFYENNSHDKTAEYLSLWSNEDCNVEVKCEIFTIEQEHARGYARTYDNKPCRIEQIAYARNQLMGMIESDTGPRSNAKYVVMIDMDNSVPLPVDLILKCIKRDPNGFDALICNAGYDLYAYRDSNILFGPELLPEFWSKKYLNYIRFSMKNNINLHYRNVFPYIPVTSGFNGLCIFRRDAIWGVRYSAIPTIEMNSEYEKISQVLPKQNVVIGNGVYLFATNKKLGLFYLNNSGYNFPIVCEHVPFFARLRARNCGRIYMCCDLIWYHK